MDIIIIVYSLQHTYTQYLGKTHNYWHGSALLLEERVLSEQEVAGKVRQIPSYDGNYGDQILDPLQQVRDIEIITRYINNVNISLDPSLILRLAYTRISLRYLDKSSQSKMRVITQ